MIASLIFGVALGLASQSPAVVQEGTLAWATDVLMIHWIHSGNGKPMEPPKNIEMYSIRCGPTSGQYTSPFRPLHADQLVVGLRAIVEKPTEPTQWFCIVESTRKDGSRGQVSPEFAFIVE